MLAHNHPSVIPLYRAYSQCRDAAISVLRECGHGDPRLPALWAEVNAAHAVYHAAWQVQNEAQRVAENERVFGTPISER
jgi:hypothetical protein